MSKNEGKTSPVETMEDLFGDTRVPSGRHVVEVEVVEVGEQVHSRTAMRFGARPTMMLRHADGWSAWGTRPEGVKKGDKLSLAATFKPSARNPSFGFFSHPRVKQENPPPEVKKG